MSMYDVHGLVSLDLERSDLFYFLDCRSSFGVVSNLVWEKEMGTNRFRVSFFNDYLRLNLSSPRVGSSDLGVYICRSTLTGEKTEVIVKGGLHLIC